ncbi:hypothetical protein G7B40_012340 [Aetokthonos hydrillicola Thurmond2011]|jgi:hypothetical protein|uniref:Uncharacterized protein n=1 Tax=Aetokthonos hydrillicola Thurmond2011 TaxID=2712845 RepID=A0AAP5IA87_9CYAN|nr:hypothetical protein [Aetokthonos hydrillicola]MBO3463809.1 hypothetical protein [Aetokthonos hydrillicola CCALA 1050]MBW4584803.1 hypothetical protein [Aetokthonos hydrillicola CCALA 1050]MDR9895350.1 hypothetical protein [Aetokthonos hydrillicola Thurmond2011]
MKKPFSNLTQFVFVTVAGISFASLVIPQPSFAGSSNALQNLTPQNDNPLAPNTSEVNSTGSSIFELMHRVQLGNTTWNADEQNQQLNDAASAFKAKQQQLLQQSSQQKPANTRQLGN